MDINFKRLRYVVQGLTLCITLTFVGYVVTTYQANQLKAKQESVPVAVPVID